MEPPQRSREGLFLQRFPDHRLPSTINVVILIKGSLLHSNGRQEESLVPQRGAAITKPTHTAQVWTGGTWKSEGLRDD